MREEGKVVSPPCCSLAASPNSVRGAGACLSHGQDASILPPSKFLKYPKAFVMPQGLAFTCYLRNAVAMHNLKCGQTFFKSTLLWVPEKAIMQTSLNFVNQDQCLVLDGDPSIQCSLESARAPYDHEVGYLLKCKQATYCSSSSRVATFIMNGGDLRYCQKCGHHKPPRAHHCRVCKRCVLRMDHHCVWINNCVGHENYKAFFLFVLYVVIACFYAMVLLVGSAVQELQDDEQKSGNASKTSYVLCGAILVPLTLALSILLVWHLYLLSHNKTTIEYHEGVRAMWLDEKAGRVYRHPYDLGIFPNLVSVLGPNLATWICPTAIGHIGSGLRFQTFYDSISHEQGSHPVNL
eukprot:Gb_28807 [translate_table: standard]